MTAITSKQKKISAKKEKNKSDSAFRTISEVSEELELPQHVLRFWESKFTQINPMKRGGRRRFYRPEDLEVLRRIQYLLHKEGYTIKGVQRLLKDGSYKKGQTTLDLNEKERAELNLILIELSDIQRLLS